MRRARVALAAGLALLILALGVTLLQSPMSVARTNAPAGAEEEPIASTERNRTYCQAHELLPRGIAAIRVWLAAAAGPRVHLTASADGHALTSGQRGSGWSGGSVTIPVKPLARPVSDVTLCVSLQLHDEAVIVQGSQAPPALAARGGGVVLGGRMWIEYLRPGDRSWASLIPSIVRAIGLGRADPGTWIALLALSLMATVAALASCVAFRELR